MSVGIRDIFIDPPLAVARLGGSSMPQDAYLWVSAPEPRAGDTTTIAPTWSLAVQQDATVTPVMPTQVVLRDGPLIRPVCPFFEVWARVGKAGSRPASWRDVPLTPALLAQSGGSLAGLVLDVDAKNLKAARRTGNRDLGFGTFPPVRVAGDAYAPVNLLGTSPSGAREPLIPPGMNIPMGAVQMIRSRPQPSGGVEWAPFVNVEVIRFRYTPARGFVYGVPAAATPSAPIPGTSTGPPRAAVDPELAFLNPRAGWSGTPANDLVEPSDTYDGASSQRNLPSLGVVDDTCEVRFEATLRLPGRKQVLSATAHAFVGPPDFAPDRRPFLSMADEINDRGRQSRTRRKMSAAETDAWVQDLFERVFETASLFNVDMYRELNAQLLRNSQRRPTPVPLDQVPRPSHAMGGLDRLRAADTPLPLRTPDEPLTLTEHALERHRELADLIALRDLIRRHPGRIQRLVRRPFAVEAGETSDVTSMNMPPFMRNSNAMPLSLSAWQYDLLIQWVERQSAAREELTLKAKVRHAQVLARERRNARLPKS